MNHEQCQELKMRKFAEAANKEIKREDLKEHLAKLEIECQKIDALCNEGPRLVRDILPEFWRDLNEKRHKLNLPPIDFKAAKNKTQ